MSIFSPPPPESPPSMITLSHTPKPLQRSHTIPKKEPRMNHNRRHETRDHSPDQMGQHTYLSMESKLSWLSYIYVYFLP